MPPRTRATWTLVPAAMLLAANAFAQIPDTFENLRVLDKDIDKRTLVTRMRDFAGALGVRCNHCHVGDDPNSLEGYDWVSDEKASKRTARAMLLMVNAINNEYIATMPKSGEQPVEVSCVTCHRGQDKPRLIQDVLALASEDGGFAALESRYRELRERYYGRHTFDFSANVLSNMAQEAALRDDMEDARQLLWLNLEYYPEDAMTYMLLARIAADQGDKDAAVGYFDKAIQYQTSEDMKERIRKMKQRVLDG